MSSKREYVKVAAILHDALFSPEVGAITRVHIMDAIISPMADMFEDENERFDRNLFIGAIGYPQEDLA